MALSIGSASRMQLTSKTASAKRTMGFVGRPVPRRCPVVLNSYAPLAPASGKAEDEPGNIFESVASLFGLFGGQPKPRRPEPTVEGAEELPLELAELLASMSHEEGGHGGVARHSHIAEMLATESRMGSQGSFEV